MPRDYGDKPKRSWREIDQKKDSSKHRAQDRPEMSGHKKVRADLASQTYRAKLDAFFDGDAKAPEHVKEKLADLAPSSPEAIARAKALKNIKDAGTSSAADKAVAAFLKKWELPPDFEILAQVLTCSEEDYVEKALALLEQLFDEKRAPKRTQVLEQRLRRVKSLADDPDLQDKADALMGKLRLFS